MISAFRKTAIPIVAVIGAILILIWVKAFWCSARDFRLGQRYLGQEDYTRAITFFDRSMRWYAPLNPYVHRSAKRLWDVALLAERNGDIPLALIALRTIRQGCYASQSFYTPGAELIRRCDSKIGSLTGQEHEGLTQTTPSEQKRDTAPDIFWSFVIEIGLMGWIGSVLGFLCFGLTSGPKTGLKSRMGIVWGALFIVCYTLWILGMTKA